MVTPRRNDARRNREAILRVAHAAFAADSGDLVPLHEIARRTGLARATVYRHFPDRYKLADAVVAQHLDTLRGIVAVAEGDGLSFRDLLESVLTMEAAMRPLVVLLRDLPASDQQHLVEVLIGVLTPPFRRAQAAGRLRPDMEPGDLALILSMLDAAAAETLFFGDRDAALRRLIAVVLDGLFPAP